MCRFSFLLKASFIPLLISASSLFGGTGQIQTIAGAGQGGSLASGIPAMSAQLVGPSGIYVDASKNVFIADSGNNRVVGIQYSTGTLFQIVGNGTASSTGDGGPWAQATVNDPIDVVLDSAGNLYIAEYQGNRIRRANVQTGTITTVVGTGTAGFGGDGGPAQAASLNHPTGIAFDSAGNLYIADMGNARIRRVDGQSGIITTVAGNGATGVSPDGLPAASASLAQPAWVAVDLSGALFISELGAKLVRRVDPATGLLSTAAGNGGATFTGDGVPATSTGIGGAVGITLDANGNLYIADGTGRIRMVNGASGLITTVAGNGTGTHGMSSAGGGGGSTPPCFANVVGDNGPATNATLDGAFGLQVASGSANLLIADALDCRIRVVDLPSPYPYTNTTLASTATSLQAGQSAVLTATVTPIAAAGVPTGQVKFMDSSGNVLGTGVLNGGTASLLVGPSAVGSAVTAVYGGDAAFNGSGSPVVTLSLSTAAKALTTVAISADRTPSPVNATTTFTATVPTAAGAPAPTGMVLLYDSSAMVAVANLVNGIAALPVVFTTAGYHNLTATYIGDNNYSQVSSATLAQPVGTASQVVVTSNLPNSIYGQDLTFTVSVTPSSATGTVQLTVDQASTYASVLGNGVAIISVPILAAGTHTITASYSGDSTNPPAVSAALTQTIAKATPSFAVTSSLNPSTVGQAVTFTVQMTPVSNGAGLNLQISNPPANLQATWSAGMTSITTPDLSAGTHTVTGAWGGDANVLPGTSQALIQTVQAVATTTSLAAAPNPSIYGGSVTLTATVQPATAAGIVVFFNNGAAVASANLAGGQAQASITTLPVGSNSLTATYGGNTTYGVSNSSVVTQLVTPASNPATLTLISSANPSVAGRPLWLTATISPATATGTVQFLDGATVLGSGTIAKGWATLQLSTLAIGTHSITAAYSGDVNNLAGTSAVLSQAIAPASPPSVQPAIITTLFGSANGCAPGVSYCGIVSPTADAAGNLYFWQGYQILKRAPDGTVSSIAGNGQYGSSGDGGPALAATVSGNQLAVHGTRLCFGAPDVHKIRCVDLGTGLIQGYGSGTQGSGGDGGNVANASFDAPSGAVFDDADNLYISDFSRNNVRRIDATTSVVTTIAGPGPGYSGAPLGDGGPAVGANLLQPEDLAYYNGGIYIADGNGQIRRVDLASGMITSVTAANTFNIAIDPSGDIFFRSGLTINMIDPSGNLSPIADTNNYSGVGDDDILATNTVFGGMRGLGFDPAGNRLLIADQSRLRQIFFTPATTTTLTASPNPVAPGGRVTLEATVTPSTATGSVRFYQNGKLLGSAPAANGVADFTWLAPAPGSSTAGMRAVYGGDANDNLSTSDTVTVTVQQGTTPTTTTLTTTPNPSVPGTAVQLNVTVSPAAATGTVSFYAGGTLLGTATLVGGQAQLSATTLPAGSNLLMAVYSGDLTYAVTTSNSVTQVVAAAPSVTVASSLNPSTAGQAVSLTASLVPATATGTVQFLDGGSALGTSTISGGAASLAVSTLTAGPHSITAVYSGDLNNPGATSGALLQTVNKALSTVTLSSSANPSTVGQAVTLAVVVAPSGATGTVQFLDGGAVLGTAAVTNGVASLDVSTLSADTHAITAVYSGDGTYLAGTSPVLTQIVNKVTTSVAMVLSQNPAPFGQGIPLAATVTPISAGGTVKFLEGSSVLGTATVAGGTATLSIATLPVGRHAITAVYSGDAANAGSTSSAVTETINPRVTTLAVSSSVSPSAFGQAVTFTASVTPASASGTVQFLDGSTVLATVAVASGSASTVATLPVGTHSVSASYSGDTNDAPSASASISQIVQQAPSTTTLSSNTNRSPQGQPIPMSVAVSPASATGSVSLMSGATVLATAALVSGAATFNISNLPAGSNSIYARYLGDASYLASNSATIVQIVLIPTSTVLTSSPNPSAFGSTVTLTVTASPSSATGPVQFNSGATILGTANLVNGKATLPLASLPVGQSSLVAYYSGDDTHAGFASPTITQTVNKASSSVAVTSSKNPSINGDSVTFTATLSPGSATGTVQILDGNTALGTVAVTDGTAALAVSALTVGTHSIKAVYSGESRYLGSTSAPMTQTVTPPAHACHVTYTVTGQWNTGFGTSISIQNTGTAPVNGWSLTWTWPGNQKITQSWNAIYSQTGANAKLTNQSYNPAIAPGATLNGVGFNGSYSGTNAAPGAFYLNGTLCN